MFECTDLQSTHKNLLALHFFRFLNDKTPQRFWISTYQEQDIFFVAQQTSLSVHSTIVWDVEFEFVLNLKDKLLT